MTLDEAVSIFPEGTMTKRALLRRIKKGVRGVRLEGHYDGMRWYVTRQAIETHIQELTRQRTGQVERIQTRSDQELLQETFDALESL